MTGKSRLLLVEDHGVLLEGLRLELQEEFEIVGMLSLGAPVTQECIRLLPDLVILDLSLPDRSGIEVIEEVVAAVPGTRILVVTQHCDRILADACLQSGAAGYLPKGADVNELREAVRSVLDGDRYVSPRVGIRPAPCTTFGAGFGMVSLTHRQRQIMWLLGEGRSSAAIGLALKVSSNTITFHRKRIREALGISTEWDLMRHAMVIRMNEQNNPN